MVTRERNIQPVKVPKCSFIIDVAIAMVNVPDMRPVCDSISFRKLFVALLLVAVVPLVANMLLGIHESPIYRVDETRTKQLKMVRWMFSFLLPICRTNQDMVSDEGTRV